MLTRLAQHLLDHAEVAGLAAVQVEGDVDTADVEGRQHHRLQHLPASGVPERSSDVEGAVGARDHVVGQQVEQDDQLRGANLVAWAVTAHQAGLLRLRSEGKGGVPANA